MVSLLIKINAHYINIPGNCQEKLSGSLKHLAEESLLLALV